MPPVSTSYRTAAVPSTRMPGGIPYIIGNEAAERFSFYGMRAILVVFMTQYLYVMGPQATEPMTEAVANEKYHTFVAAVYFFPIVGALLADIITGKYRTIIALSIVYCLGHAALAMMGSIGKAENMLFLGLSLIAIGSGGIKPCVSAHVGDQFGKSNAHLLEKVYNWFYFSINTGAFISMMATPWLLQWYGPHLAFGIPGILMALATLVFWMGRHKFIHVPAKGTPFLREVFSRAGLMALGKVSAIFAFVAMFWALFDQTGSSWVLQAYNMNLNWLGIEWIPSQIQSFNSALVLVLIPVFAFVIYPAINKVFPLTPLRKISIGMFVAVASFAIIAVAQQIIDGGGRPSIGWQAGAYVILTAAEVMVSITCLEFAYTQSPKTMKSVVMALFLMSVTLGNVFAAVVNARIQLPDPTKVTDGVVAESKVGAREKSEKIHPGMDGKEGTEDDITMSYIGTKRVRTGFPGYATVESAMKRIDDWSKANEGALPALEVGNTMLADLKDAWGAPLRYYLFNTKRYRITSDGPDKTPGTEWDMGFQGNAPEMKKGDGDEDKEDNTWLAKRIRELAASAPESISDDSAFVGGQTKLEGASYFWFFTWMMFGTAVVFVVAAKLYRSKTYLHDEDTSAAAIDEGTTV